MHHALRLNEIMTIVEPGTYTFNVLSGPVFCFEDGELPKAIPAEPIKVVHRFHLLATGSAGVVVDRIGDL